MPLVLNGSTGITAANIADATITSDKVATLATTKLTGQLADANAPSGCVIQVVQSVKTDAYASASGAQWVTIPGLSATITPSSSSNKILVFFDIKFVGNTDESISRLRMMRNSTAIYIGDAAGSRPTSSAGQNYWTGAGSGGYNVIASGGLYLDSPATLSSITYTAQIGGDGNGNVLFVNRTESDRDTGYYDTRTASSITLMEIAA